MELTLITVSPWDGEAGGKRLLRSSRCFTQLVMGPRAALKGTMMMGLKILRSLGGKVDSKLATAPFETSA